MIELVVVIVLLGILSAVAAISLRGPIEAYRDAKRRAELTDIADVALRRMARDIRRALPNSPRVVDPGTGQMLELLLTRTGGRYREQPDTALTDPLFFNVADNRFDTLGSLSNLAGQYPQANDLLVIHNLFSANTNPQANAYNFNQGNCTAATTYSMECNVARISAVAETGGVTRISFDSRRFPLSSPGNRFFVVEPSPVTYRCTPGAPDSHGNGTGTLTRISGYPVALTQPTAFGPGATQALLARNVTACQIAYTPLVTQTMGLVALRLQLTRGNETVSLYHEVHVSNIP